MPGEANPALFQRHDGSVTAYEVLGNQDTDAEPIVLVAGLSMVRGDWERLADPMSKYRKVLIYDHRGIGDSTFSKGDDVITIESLARDLLDLLIFLEWKKFIFCGFSMGGLIAQQLLFLPYVVTNPTPLPFQVKHLILAGTLAGPKDKEPGFKISLPKLQRPPTREERREFSRPMVHAAFDPIWYNDPANSERADWWLDRISGRPMKVIGMQARAIDTVKLEDYYPRLSSDIKVLVIHGKLDEIVPFSYSDDILRHIPWAKRVEVGMQPGQVEHLDFGHNWFEYFDSNVWCEVIERFVG
ncbi:hypothetical protein HYPSUDRAFT_198377 [Hypholoma sublateritium FD-334 SS-4]|uniref:AB hydrolase-1 domain-containing protein n=1 Tax=Hypholoma sublateritium (strain FD-334 SS-4) TaxID=945553 RepID=A0A0D2MSU5_HYPSF|nr:hypothetical protein HYPSUDRAFT_198377 [Hypholoma sublateritium FD-334 SS-4]